MFTRRGDSRAVRTLPDPTMNQLHEARLAAANGAATPLVDPAQLAASAMPPPVPPAPAFAAAPPAASVAPDTAAPDAHRSVIGEDLSIEGQAITIRCKGALEINGRIQAELHSQKLIVGSTGEVEGTMAAEAIEIWGRVNGTVMGARVTLHPGAEVEGDIHAKSLSVADGASFEGRSRKVADAASIAPRLEAGAAPTMSAVPIPLPVPEAARMASAAV